MPELAAAQPIVPIPAADALFVENLRVGLECYFRGDYQQAVDRWLDAGGCGRTRPDAALWILLADQLDALLRGRLLRSRTLSEGRAVRSSL